MTDNSDRLIKSEIKGRNVTYYLTTEDDLHNVKNNSLLGDIFSVLTSLAVGGIISVILTRATGIQLQQETMNVLDILMKVFVVAAVISAVFTAYFYYQSLMSIKKIKGSGAVKSLTSANQREDSKTEKVENKMVTKQSRLDIVKAEYWTEKNRLDVTEELRRMIIDNKLEAIASNNIKGDPDKGTQKRLTIEYEFNGIAVTKEFKERDKVLIP
jgi:hypothetical protein